MMHLTCTNMPESQLENALDKVRLCWSITCPHAVLATFDDLMHPLIA